MFCPKCGTKMIDKVCIKCGFLENGKKVKISQDDFSSDLELYEKDFHNMINNKKLLKPFLFGALYITYKGYFALGFVLGFIEWLISLFVFSFFYSLAYQYKFAFAFAFWFVYFLITRMFIAGVLNTFVLFLNRKKIAKIKKNHPKNYRLILANHKVHGTFLTIFNILIYILIFILFNLLMNM